MAKASGTSARRNLPFWSTPSPSPHHITPKHTPTWICYKQCAKKAAGTSHNHPYINHTNTPPSGGRAEFKWEDVKNDAQRENYLGHSLMAPVGRWQQNRDLNWYAKGDVEGKEAEAARIKEEKRKLKEAEEDAMLAAMGLPVPERNNANLTPLGEKAHEKDVKDVMEEKAKGGGEEEERAKRRERKERERERRHRDRDGEGRESRKRRHERSRSRDQDRSRRHRDRSRERERRRDGDRERERRRHRSRSREHTRRDDRAEPRRRDTDDKPSEPRARSRSRSRDRRRPRDGRSRSPYKTERRRD